jgi:hypothetical protein
LTGEGRGEGKSCRVSKGFYLLLLHPIPPGEGKFTFYERIKIILKDFFGGLLKTKMSVI